MLLPQLRRIIIHHRMLCVDVLIVVVQLIVVQVVEFHRAFRLVQTVDGRRFVQTIYDHVRARCRIRQFVRTVEIRIVVVVVQCRRVVEQIDVRLVLTQHLHLFDRLARQAVVLVGKRTALLHVTQEHVDQQGAERYDQRNNTDQDELFGVQAFGRRSRLECGR